VIKQNILANGLILNINLFVEDQVIVVNTKDELQRAVYALNNITITYNFNISVNQGNIMAISAEMQEIHLRQQHKIANKIKTQNTNIGNNNTNYDRLMNYTNIQFTQSETQLLNKGLQYNLHHKNKNWIKTLALEAEAAINNLHIKEQSYYRHAVAKKKKDISKNNKENINIKSKDEWKTIINIRNKIRENNLIVTKA
jgi:hypothetical protein